MSVITPALITEYAQFNHVTEEAAKIALVALEAGQGQIDPALVQGKAEWLPLVQKFYSVKGVPIPEHFGRPFIKA